MGDAEQLPGDAGELLAAECLGVAAKRIGIECHGNSSYDSNLIPRWINYNPGRRHFIHENKD
jgi:hypothetical protein